MSNMKLWFKQNSPTILLATGVVGAASSIVLACVATKKSEKVIEPAKLKIVQCHEALKNTNNVAETEAIKKDIRSTYIKTGFKVASYYAPAVFVFGLSVASLVGSNNIMKGRNIALASTVTALKSSYDAYRNKVKDKIGEEAESAIFDELHSKKKKIVLDQKEDGTTEEKVVYSKEEDPEYLFGCLWGPGNEGYEPRSSQLNITTLTQVELWANQVLRARGVLFLSDVYERLGYTAAILGEKRLQAARSLGWIFDTNDKTRDSYVDFGIHNESGSLTNKAKEFACGKEDYIWLEFNVDGDIVSGENGCKTFMSYAIKKSV